MYTVASGTQFSIALGDGPFISLYYPILSIWILQIIVIFTIAINTDNWTVATFDWIFSFTQWRGETAPSWQLVKLINSHEFHLELWTEMTEAGLG